ncbi:MAG: hypothetical protein ABMA13_17085, partial [Chthoniobacteraceae bacterium]
MSLRVSNPSPVSLDLAPVEVAARMRHLPGLVFFDSALEGARRGQISIVAAEPSPLLRGTLRQDAGLLREAIAAHRSESADHGVPTGFLAGSVDYDGAFCFGLYENALIHRHDDGSWLEVGDCLSKLGTPGTGADRPGVAFTAGRTRDDYCAMVERALDYI